MKSEPAVYRAGAARTVITPPLGVSLAGYFHDRKARRVRDELHARAVVLQDGEQKLAIVSLDLVSVDAHLVQRARERIGEETGLDPAQVLICATHTHTGPEVRLEGNAVPRDDQWLAELPDLIASAVGKAERDLVEVTIRPGCLEVDGYIFNRIYRLRDGTERMGRGRGDDVLGPAGPVDPRIYSLALVERGGDLRCLMVNVGLHVDVIGGGGADFLSADYPAEIANTVAAVYGKGVETLFLLGSCGDTNHRSYEPTHLPTGGEEKSIQLGRGLAGAAICAWERAEPLEMERIRSATRTVRVPYYTRTPAILEEVKRLKNKADPSPRELHFVEQVESWPYDGKEAEVQLQVLLIGDVALIGLPFQIFTRQALEIKTWSPARRTMIIELANARVSGYVPTPDQARRGAYGTQPILSRWLCADAGRVIADALQVMLHDLW